jgi:hypothetical protein
MTKTAQQKRFEAAWQIKWPNDEPRIFHQDSKGQYTWPEVQDTFEGFALGEASALERAKPEFDDRWGGWIPYSYDEMPPVGEPVLVTNDKRRIYVAMLMPEPVGEGYYWCEFRQERGAVNDPNCFEAPSVPIEFNYWRALAQEVGK